MHVVTRVAGRLLAQGRSLRHRSDSVRFLRSFCRADEATGMPLHDPMQTKTVPIMGDGRTGGGTEGPAATGDRDLI